MRTLREAYLGEEEGRQRWQGMQSSSKRKSNGSEAATRAKRSKETSPVPEKNTPERPLDGRNKGYAMLASMAGGYAGVPAGAAPVTVKAVDGSAGLGSKKMLGIAEVAARGEDSVDWRKSAQARRWAELNGGG